MSRLLKSLRSTELDNTGSTARDHCANERTFLAWLRTSLTLVSFGIALAQFFRLPTSDSPSTPPGASPENQNIAHTASIWNGIGFTITASNGTDLTYLAKPLGSSIVLLGILTLVFGARRYFQVQEQLIRGRFESSRSEVFVIVTLVAALLIAVLSVIIAAPQPS
ncbi:unnamed protein product [Sympodiomycopsis kandeliae]